MAENRRGDRRVHRLDHVVSMNHWCIPHHCTWRFRDLGEDPGAGWPRAYWRDRVKNDLQRLELTRECAEADLSDVGLWPDVSAWTRAESRSL